MCEKDTIYVLEEKKSGDLVAWSYDKKDLNKYAKSRKLKKSKIKLKKKEINRFSRFFILYEEYQLEELYGEMITYQDMVLLNNLKCCYIDKIISVRKDLKSFIKDFKFKESEAEKIKDVIDILKKYTADDFIDNENKINKFIRFKNIVKKFIKDLFN